MHKILIVEDDEPSRSMLCKRLQRKGFEVLTAEDGEKGMQMARIHLPDLILMDLTMPGVDGWEATRQLRGAPQTRYIPVIAVTAHTGGRDREKALTAGFDDYESKPVDLPCLLGKIMVLLEGERRNGLNRKL